MMLAAAALALLQVNDKIQANGRDDAWENAWVTHCRTVYTATGKTIGMVIHLGDSITYSNAYGQWPRNGAGRTTEDDAVRTWCMAGLGFPAGNVPTDTNGYYLAAVDVNPSNARRSMTAAGGISTGEYLAGSGNGSVSMPSTTNTGTAQGYVASTTYDADLHITTVASAFAAAQFAVVMLGTNDAGGNVAAGTFSANLTSIVDVLEGRNIVVILSTVPPRNDGKETAYNDAIRTLARSRGLPLIDYHAEILARQPGTAWQGTLIGADGVHPTAPNPAGDAYTPGGDPTTHKTGTNAANDGYLLRGWLTVQKLKEVKDYVADGNNPPSPSTSPTPTTPTTPPTTPTSSGGGPEPTCSCGGSVDAGLQAFWLVGALLALAYARKR
jgi:hypothetical protein